eukprot:365180-Chlamydomonas_euryale.AAC.11
MIARSKPGQWSRAAALPPTLTSLTDTTEGVRSAISLSLSGLRTGQSGAWVASRGAVQNRIACFIRMELCLRQPFRPSPSACATGVVPEPSACGLC